VILSREEGACYASAEYLLCGTPVVTTTNIGGRDVFLKGMPHVKYVPPVPSIINETILDLANTGFDPFSIRNAVLKEMEPHRKRFKELLQNIYDKEKSDFNVSENWEQLFTNRMVEYAQPWPDSFVRQLATI
jgi:glycosyltransferase involved in cell wall biosynthesis